MSGHDDLWNYFGMSRASFLTLPRVLMHEMPDEWQRKMAALLEEYDEAFDFGGMVDDFGTTVRAVKGNKLAAMPDWVINYRRPQRDEIDRYARAKLRPFPHQQTNKTEAAE